jgi:hypothetical protein
LSGRCVPTAESVHNSSRSTRLSFDIRLASPRLTSGSTIRGVIRHLASSEYRSIESRISSPTKFARPWPSTRLGRHPGSRPSRPCRHRPHSRTSTPQSLHTRTLPRGGSASSIRSPDFRFPPGGRPNTRDLRGPSRTVPTDALSTTHQASCDVSSIRSSPESRSEPGHSPTQHGRTGFCGLGLHGRSAD